MTIAVGLDFRPVAIARGRSSGIRQRRLGCHVRDGLTVCTNDLASLHRSAGLRRQVSKVLCRDRGSLLPHELLMLRFRRIDIVGVWRRDAIVELKGDRFILMGRAAFRLWWRDIVVDRCLIRTAHETVIDGFVLGDDILQSVAECFAPPCTVSMLAR